MTAPPSPATPMPFNRAVILGLLTAGALGLAFLPLGIWPIIAIALAPWLVAIARIALRDAIRLGIVVSVTGSLAVVYWSPSAVADYFGISIAWGTAGVLMFALLAVAPYWIGFSVWIAWANRRCGLNPWVVAGAWAFCEFARAHGFGPWGLMAYALPPGSALLQIADLAGPYGVGALLASTSAIAAAAFSPAVRPNRFAAHALGVVLLATACFAYGEWRLSHDFAEGPAIEVALIQPHSDRHRRWDPGLRGENFRQPLELSKIAARKGPDLILWPEASVVAPLPFHAPTRRLIEEHSREFPGDLVVGALHAEHNDSRQNAHNSAFALWDGAIRDRYDKIELVPFAERSFLPRFLDPEKGVYGAGDRARPLSLRHARLGVAICWDVEYPELMRQLAANGADSFANLSRDDWFGGAVPAWQQLRIAALRSIENRRFMARPTSGGHTAMIDAHGRVIERGTYGKPDIVYAELYTSTATTPYQRIGDAFPWVAGVAALLWPYRAGRRSRHRQEMAGPTGPESDLA